MLVPGFEEHAPTNPPNEPVFNDLSSRDWTVYGFLKLHPPTPPPLPSQCGHFSVLCLVVSCYKSSQLASHFIGHFSDRLVLAVGKGGEKPPSGSEA